MEQAPTGLVMEGGYEVRRGLHSTKLYYKMLTGDELHQARADGKQLYLSHFVTSERPEAPQEEGGADPMRFLNWMILSVGQEIAAIKNSR